MMLIILNLKHSANIFWLIIILRSHVVLPWLVKMEIDRFAHLSHISVSMLEFGMIMCPVLNWGPKLYNLEWIGLNVSVILNRSENLEGPYISRNKAHFLGLLMLFWNSLFLQSMKRVLIPSNMKLGCTSRKLFLRNLVKHCVSASIFSVFRFRVSKINF